MKILTGIMSHQSQEEYLESCRIYYFHRIRGGILESPKPSRKELQRKDQTANNQPLTTNTSVSSARNCLLIVQHI